MSGFSSDERVIAPLDDINDIIDRDAAIPEFFTLIDDLNGQDDMGYAEMGSLCCVDFASKFPSDVLTRYRYAMSCVDCGYLPGISRFYASIDNALFLWTTTGTLAEQTSFDGQHVLSVCCMRASNDVFRSRVPALLAVALPATIVIFVVDRNCVKFDTFYTVDTKFVPHVMCAGDYNELFVGGSDGNVHRVTFSPPSELQWQDGDKKPIIAMGNVTRSLWKALIPGFLSFGNPAPVKMCFDPSSGSLAVLDASQKVTFWSRANNGSISSVGSYSVPKGVQLVELVCVSKSESMHIRFIGITKAGQRYFFGTTETFRGQGTGIALRGMRKLPDSYADVQVSSGFYSLGFTVMLSGRSLIVLRSSCIEGREYIARGRDELPKDGICLGGHNYMNRLIGASVCRDPSVWQHFQDRPKLFVMLAGGTAEITLSQPYHLFVYNTVAAMEPCFGASALMAAIESAPGQRRVVMRSLVELAQETEGRTVERHNFFYQHVARVLSVIWNSTVFARTADNEICIAYPFKAFGHSLIDTLQKTLAFIEEYHRMSKINGLRTDVESEPLASLQIFMNHVVEILKLIVILSEQPAGLLAVGLNGLRSQSLKRLERHAFFDKTVDVLLVDALREYSTILTAAKHDTQIDSLVSRILTDCPTMSRSTASLIACAMDQLELAGRMDVDFRPELIRYATLSLLSHVDQPLELMRICELLFAVEAWAPAVRIVCARVNVIDAVEQGLYWWKNGCDDSDLRGHDVFCVVHECYEALFQAIRSPEGRKAVFECDNELLHVVMFKTLLQANETELLFSLESKYMEDYIRAYTRVTLHKFFIAKGRYGEAAEELLHIAIDGVDFSLDTRISWLESARSYAKTTGKRDLVDKAKSYVKSTRIKKMLNEKKGIRDLDVSRPCKLSELLDMAREAELWDICLYVCDAHNADYDVPSTDDIGGFWRNLITSCHRGSTPGDVEARVALIFSKIPRTSLVMKPACLVAPFEDARAVFDFKPTWAVEFLTSLQIDGSHLYDIYCDIILNQLSGEAPIRLKNQLILCATWLLRTYRGDSSRIEPLLRGIQECEDAPYHSDLCDLLV